MHGLLFTTLFLGASVAAQAQPTVVNVGLSNFKFTPASIQLRSGAPTTLQLQNASSGGHSFSAPEFFTAARIDRNSAVLVRNGTVDVPAHGAVTITLVPARGTYRLKCTHTLHSTFGMKGTIFVN